MDKLNNFNLFNGLNINPIPLEFTQGITTTEWLGFIQAKVNELINGINKMYTDVTDETDKKIIEVKNNLISELNKTNKTLDNVIERVEVLEAELGKADKIVEYIKETINPHFERIDISILELLAEDKNIHNEIMLKYNELVDLINQGNYNCYSPLTGEYVSIEQALKDVLYAVAGIHGVSWDTIVKIAKDNAITWSGWITNINNGANWRTWNALTYYSNVALQEYFIRQDIPGAVTFENTPQFVSFKSHFLNNR